MQSFSSRIWTRVAVSISYDDNHYTTGTSKPSSDDDNVQLEYTYYGREGAHGVMGGVTSKPLELIEQFIYLGSNISFTEIN